MASSINQYDAFGNQFPINTGGYLYGKDPYASSQNEETTANDITGAEMLAVIDSGLIGALKDDMEEARLRCEDEEDDTSLGEYIAYQAVIERAEKFIRSAAGSRYDRRKIEQAMKQRGLGGPHPTRAYYQP